MKIFRFILLIVLAFGIQQFIFWNIQELGLITRIANSTDTENESIYVEGRKGSFEEVFGNFPSLGNVPISLLYYDVYLLNKWRVEVNETGETISAYINIDLSSFYTHEVEYNKKTKVLDSVRGADITTIETTRSFTPYNGIPIEETDVVVGSYYQFSIWPDLNSWLFTYLFVSLPISFGFLVIFNNLLRFVVHGAPFMNRRMDT